MSNTKEFSSWCIPQLSAASDKIIQSCDTKKGKFRFTIKELK